ncbi:membrane or secreted protein [Flavobacteriaceae bacterium XHP0103]|nr:membrane or secreted protein [Marixanthotalea marina]
MKKTIFFIAFALFTLSIYAQSFVGAWETYYTAEDGSKLKSVVIFTDKYQVITTYDASTGKFIGTNGGTWKLDSKTMTETVEFDSVNPERVGSEVSFEVFINGNTMGIVGDKNTFTRIDDGSPGKLEGAWLMSGRVRDGETQQRDTSGPRKTMKILSGKRFQWIAYNTETKQFMGTGGGNYTTEDGIYTENIEFFSRDDSRVGASLKFDFNLVDGNWHHKGFSSQGAPLHEIWSLRE